MYLLLIDQVIFTVMSYQIVFLAKDVSYEEVILTVFLKVNQILSILKKKHLSYTFEFATLEERLTRH